MLKSYIIRLCQSGDLCHESVMVTNIERSFGMKLTSKMLAQYVGGQMEIQNQGEGYIYRGEVKAIVLEGNELRVEFVWVAKGEGFPPLPKKWVKDDKLDYVISLEIYSVSNIGPSGGEVGGDDRICFNSSIVGELAVLYPPNGSKLDPAKVEGLQLAQA